ncbi:hypothetical protein GOP47_0012859 [Adiantum capillus-veneris]|uniref:Uncharacterized protein n=1 Tax=Adiantum capillus-veneris TaxID=13818 RepID=A0A9D4USV3_ADICA|nr:hypothetical protein GOP47_0012859 [Adiantum capillus-veneris]
MALPTVFCLNPREASMLPVVSDTDVLSVGDLTNCLTDALTSDPLIKGAHKVTIPTGTMVSQVSAFKAQAIVLYFTGDNLGWPIIREDYGISLEPN